MQNTTLFRFFVTLLLGTGLLGLHPGQLRAQTYQLPVSGTATYTTCAGTLYDDGGVNGDYSANANGAVTLLPGTAGNKIKLDFTSFNVETYYDKVYVYDGTSTSAALIGSYDSSNPPGTLYATTASGALTVVLVADYIYQYSGFAATISCVTTIPQPDLTVQSATISPTSTVAGNTVSASSLVYNLSGTTASSSNLGYYLSTDNVLSSNDVYLTNATGGALSVGQSSSRYSSLTIPASTTVGTYYVLFVADYLSQVAESNENNNVASVAITVQAATPDLVMQSTTVSPTSVAAGNAVSFNSYIYNQGNSVASSSSVGFYLSTDATLDTNDQLLTSQYGYTLGAGAYGTRTGTAAIPTNTAAGSYYILFVADYQNQVAEVNENNNVSAVSITVLPPGPDLTVGSQSLYSTSVAAGTTVSAYAYLYNQGNQPASSSTLGFYLSTNTTFDTNDVLLSTSTGGALAAGGSSYRSGTLTIPTSTATGSYYVLFVADPAGAVAESNESNNVAYSSLYVYASTIDLTIAYTPSVSPSTVTAGSALSTSCYLSNLGTVAVNSATVGYYLSTNSTLDANDVLIGNSTGTYVSANSYAYVSGTATMPTGTAPGTYYVLFVADYLNQITETSKTNNVNYTTVQVTAPYIDLTIQSTSASPYQTAPGGTITTSCYLYNQGNLTANPATVGYYLSTDNVLSSNDVLLGSSAAISLTGGSYASRTGTFTIPTGTASGYYYVLFVADYLNQLTESSKTNNVNYTTIQVAAPFVDLTIQSPYVSQYQVAAGGTLNTSCYLYNQGNLPATPATVGYYLSTNSTFDTSDILIGNTTYASLAAYTSASPYGTPTVPANTPSGTYYVLFVADYLNQVTESNESNNVSAYYYTVQVIVPGVDLTIQSATLSTSSVNNGSSLSAGCYISNTGNTLASSSTVGYYLSTDATLDASDVQLNTSTGGTLGSGSSSYRSATLTIPTGTSGGTYYVLFVADPLNAVTETNKNNNVSAAILTVIGPFVGTVVPTTGTATVTTCSDKVYDNGGNNNYASNSDGTLTIKPGTAGMVSQLVFTSFSTEQYVDFLYVYDGLSTSAPLLGQYSGSNLPPTLTGSSTSGALTLRFKSDATGESTGFQATISCVQPLAARDQTAGYDVSVLPNPVAGAAPLRVQLSGLGASCAATLTLRNSLGQLVASRPFALAPGRLNQAEVATTGLATGVYILQLAGPDLNVVRRVVVE